jgi:hypothetical protein
LTGHKAHDFYNARSLLAAFSAVNPHVTFRFRQMTGSQTATELFLRQDRQWRKWLTSTQTSPHWYTDDSLRSLIAGYVAEERAGGPRRTVREFVSGFYGLSGTGKQKKVVDAANMSGLALSDLVDGEDLPLERVGVLLKALQRESRPVRAHRLGVIGEEVFRHRLEHAYGADPHNLRYKKQLSGDDANDLPFVVEVGFGIHAAERTGEPRRLVVGLNWSPAIDVHLDRLDDLLGEMRIDSDDAVTLIVHLACPRLEYLDRGKSNVALPQAIDKALVKCISHVAEDWKKTKERNIRQSKKQQAEKARKCKRKAPLGIEAAAWRVMEEAYLHASGSKANPANARQIMYAARPLVLTLIGECWKHSNQFTQKYLPKFMRRHPDLTADWDVVYDARGHLSEPHTGRRIELGTLKVREYINCWIGPSVDMSSAHTGDVIQLKQDFETFGPANRYKFVLFVEKEGFDTILRRARISERFDVALMSTKGMSVTAARALIERLSAEGVTVLVLHDFDKSGFSIVHTLSNNTERYSFRTKPNVIDTGLRLSDAKAMGLQSEYVEYKRAKKDPRDQIAKCGATEEEQDFLVSDGGGGKKWSGHRIELNAMTSPQFIEFVERKLREAGARIPPGGMGKVCSGPVRRTGRGSKRVHTPAPTARRTLS